MLPRIEREAGVPGLVTRLAERLAPTDLQSLLLEVYRRRSLQRRPADVLADYAEDRFVRPAPVSPRRLLAWEQVAFAQLPPEFEPLALAPVCPLGTSAAVAAVDQNWSVATARNSEVVSDSTNVLALECALRRRALLHARPKSAEAVHLAASHRLLRAQHYQSPDATTHFSAFALCSAGRDQGGLRFELDALARHLRFYLRSVRAFTGPTVPLHVTLTDFSPSPRYRLLQERLLAPLRAEFETVDFAFDPERTSGRGYYRDLCFHVDATHPSGRRLQLADGGAVEWTQRLLASAKERLVVSGLGSDRLCSEF